MSNIKVTNDGVRDQVIPVKGGTITVKSGRSVEIAEMKDLSEERLEHYKSRGVTFKKIPTKPKTKSKTADDVDMSAAEKAVEDAKAAAKAAGDDMAKKAEAEKALDEAEAALAALSGK